MSVSFYELQINIESRRENVQDLLKSRQVLLIICYIFIGSTYGHLLFRVVVRHGMATVYDLHPCCLHLALAMRSASVHVRAHFQFIIFSFKGLFLDTSFSYSRNCILSTDNVKLKLIRKFV